MQSTPPAALESFRRSFVPVAISMRPAAPPPAKPPVTRAPLGGWNNARAAEALAKYATMIGAEARRLRGAAERTQSLDVDDLIAEGRVAVLEALATFEGWGVNETTWVRMRVRQRMVDAVRRQSLWTREDARVMAREKSGEQLGESDRRRADSAATRRLVALDGGPTKDRHSFASILPAPNDGVDDMVDELRGHARLREAMAELPARTRLVIERMLLEGASNAAVAEELGVSASRVSQLLRTAVDRVRETVAGAA